MFIYSKLIVCILLMELLNFSNSYYIYENPEDNESILLNDFKILNDREVSSVNHFPDSFKVHFKQADENFNLKFSKSSKKNPDVYTTDTNGNLIKYTLDKPESFEHYVDNDNDAYATLILNQNSEKEPFRMIAQVISKNKENTTYDIYPIKISERRKRSLRSQNEFHHAISKRLINHDLVGGYLNPLDNKDYLIADKLQSYQSKSFKNVARVGTGPLIFYCETVLVVDLSLYQDHKRIFNSEDQNYVFGQMRIYFSHLMHGVDQKYQNTFANDTDMNLNIILTNILFIINETESTWTNSSIVGDSIYKTYDNKDVLVTSPTVGNFANYMNSKTFPFEFDHAIALFSPKKKDMWLDNGNSPAVRSKAGGYAYVTSVCTNARYSIIEESGGFSTINLIAHEMGHNFGSPHDGDTTASTGSCPSSDGYLMGTTSADQILNGRKFSNCSIAKIKSTLILNGGTIIKTFTGTTNNCLTNKPLNVLAEYQSVDYFFTGQFYEIHQQCKMNLGDSSTFCVPNSKSICKERWCKPSINDNNCWGIGPAPDGTTCDSGKMCIGGVCTTSSLAPKSACPFGDYLVNNLTAWVYLPTAFVTCSDFLTILEKKNISKAAFCTSKDDGAEKKCCSTCLEYKYANCSDSFYGCYKYKSKCLNGYFNDGVAIKDSCCVTCNTRPITCANSPLICQNGGTCTNITAPTTLIGYTCSCLENYSGYNCEIKKR